MNELKIEDIAKIINSIERIPQMYDLFVCQKIFDRLYDELPGVKQETFLYGRAFGPRIFIDDEVPEGKVFSCNHRVMELYKQVKNHPYIENSDQAFKAAVILYGKEQKVSEKL